MNGTISAKIGRAVAGFVRHPAYVPRYAKHNIFTDKTPFDFEIPWFSYAAIDFLEDFLRPHMTVCEYGSGGSTLFFARRVRSVFSIEDNSEWFARVKAELTAKSLRNATLCLHPFNFKETGGFEDSAYLHAVPEEQFDVIVVDTKVIDRISDHERGLMLNYLRITSLRVGVILNFKHRKLEWQRIAL